MQKESSRQEFDENAPSYVSIIDKLDALDDLLCLGCLGHEQASNKDLIVLMMYNFVRPEIERIKTMVSNLK